MKYGTVLIHNSGIFVRPKKVSLFRYVSLFGYFVNIWVPGGFCEVSTISSIKKWFFVYNLFKDWCSLFPKCFPYQNSEIFLRAKGMSLFEVALLWVATAFIFISYFAKVLKGQNIDNSRSPSKTVRRSRKNFRDHVRRNRANFHTYRPGFYCSIILQWFSFKIEKSESFFTQNKVVIDRW